MSERLLTAQDVAERLGVPTSWVYRAARHGLIPHIVLGRYIRFDKSDIDRWINDRKGSQT